MSEIKSCSRCSRGFFPSHGNQTLCGQCRAGRKALDWWHAGRTFGIRRCDLCFREFAARVPHQRFCSQRCARRGRASEERKYARPEHRGGRRRLAPLVDAGLVRCARGAACLRAELIDGEWLGGFIRQGERWDMGHPDGESVGGPEHAACNRGAPSRMRGRIGRW
jgi:hypothetical protein